ncbi:MAG: imidazole glycerol phosphate synthase subunit HisH [Cyclonatronaceae bacterium]
MISIIDYRAGNTASVSNALERLGATYQITNDKAALEASDGIIFPGVGHAESAMQALRDTGLHTWLQETTKPVLGICLGMQLLYEFSEEGDTPTLGIVSGRLKKFDAARHKVPHMGWNTFKTLKSGAHPLLEGLRADDYFYYVHSYYAPVTAETLAASRYAGSDFACIVARNNFAGVQFHPEKSGRAGSLLLRNFIASTSS